MKNETIDDVLKKAANITLELNPQTLQCITDSIKVPLDPVRSLPQTWVLATGLVLTCAAVSLTGAARAGFFGFKKMDLLESSVIFSELVLLVWLVGIGFIHEMIPGSRRRVSPGTLMSFGSAALLAAFALLFRDYRIDHFLSIGIICLLTGLIHAVPAALLCWLILRRGYATNLIAAGWVAGMLGGLSGVGVLELHCPNFQAAHVLVWHTLVIPLGSALGALTAWALRFRLR